MPELWQSIYPILIEAVLPMIVAVLGTVGAWAINALRRKLDSDLCQAVLNRVQDVGAVVVREIEQTIVPEVKKAMADGKLSPEEAERIREIAITRVMLYLGGEDVYRLQKKTGKARDVIAGVVESELYKMKEW